MDSIPDSSVHVYTLVIIVFLVLAVVIWIVTTLETSWEGLVGMDSGSSSASDLNGHRGRFKNWKLRK